MPRMDSIDALGATPLALDDESVPVAASATAANDGALLDAYSSKPPNPAIKNNDVALLTAVVYKF